MTKLQKVALKRIKKLVKELHMEMCCRVPFTPDGMDKEKVKQILVERDKESARLWSEDNRAKDEIVDILEALLSEGGEEDQ